jgi:uncharacterized protein (TIGR00369 family)
MTAHAGPPRSADEQVRVEEALRDLWEHRITFNQVLGMKVESLDPRPGPRASFAMRPDLVGHYLYGRLHGGAIAAALDATGGMALMVAVADKHRDETAEQIMARFAKVGTIDLRVDYLRPGIGQRFVVSGTVLRLGGRIGTTQMQLENESGVLIAAGTGAYVLS